MFWSLNCNNSNSLFIKKKVPKGNGCRLLAGCNICSDSVHPRWCNNFSVTGYCCVLLRSSDDIDHRSSHTNIAQASSVPFAPPQIPVSASMPWLGSGQTSMGASVVRISLTQTPLKRVMTALPQEEPWFYHQHTLNIIVCSRISVSTFTCMA